MNQLFGLQHRNRVSAVQFVTSSKIFSLDNKNKKIDFCFVFFSLIRIFVGI